MCRIYRILAITTLAAFLLCAVPAAAAPAAEWSLFDRCLPFDWIIGLFSPETEGTTPPATPRQLWGQSGSMIDPSGLPQIITEPDPSNP